MFTHKHYIPILRWKAAEKGALQNLKSEHKSYITPLIEFIMPQPKNQAGEKTSKDPKDLLQESIGIFKKNLPNIAANILKHWGQEAIFLDVQLIDSSIRADSLGKILDDGSKADIFMIPVITIIPVIGFESDIQTRQVAVNFAKKSKNGLCLRITDSNFSEITLAQDINNFVTKNDLKIEDIDLLIDFKIIDEKMSCESLIKKINLIPHPNKWRTFIVASGAFPKDLSHLEKHNQHYISRADWSTWTQLIQKLKRRPSFADYAIQYPIYSPQNSASNPSASIRYTVEDNWVIVRGEGLRNPKGAGFKQYPAQAQILASQKKIFKGENFSFGDSYIDEKAKDINTKKTGNPKTWLEAGINHHLSLVADQISNLP